MNAPEATRRDGAEAILAELPMLKALPEDARGLVIESFEPESFGFGASIVEEGEAGDALYVILSGEARVLKRTEDGGEVSVEMLGPGDVFGEMALLDGIPRTATVRAHSPVDALRLDGTVFRALVRLKPEIRAHFERAAERGRLRYLFRLSSDLSRNVADTLDELIDALERVTVDEGEIVIRQGERSSRMYFVESGRLRVVWETEDGRAQGDIAYKRRGDFFGEHSLLRGTATANVEAVTPAVLLALAESDFSGSPRPTTRSAPCSRIRSPSTTSGSSLAFRSISPRSSCRRIRRCRRRSAWSRSTRFARARRPGRIRPRSGPASERAPAQADSELSPRLADRRDGLRRRLPGHGLPVLRAGGQPAVPPEGRLHGVDGTSLTGIAAGAETVGLRVRSVKASKTRLDELPLPAVCHYEGNHWVVVFDTDGRRVRLADPAVGVIRMKRAEFEKKWSGYAALLARGPASKRHRSVRQRCSGSGSSSARSGARSPSPPSWL